MTEAEQILKCLNCDVPVKQCKGDCMGMTSANIHRRKPQELEALILKFYPGCSRMKDLSEATGIDRSTLRKYCIRLRLDMTKFQRGKPKTERRPI